MKTINIREARQALSHLDEIRLDRLYHLWALQYLKVNDQFLSAGKS